MKIQASCVLSKTKKPKKIKLATMAIDYIHKQTGIVGDELSPREYVVDELGEVHIRFDRFYQSIAVNGGTVIVHFKKDGQLSGIDGITERLFINTRPTIRAEDVWSSLNRIQDSSVESKVNLEILLRDDVRFDPRLCWHISISSIGEEPLFSREYFIDAHSGKMLLDYSNIYEAAARGTGYGYYYSPVKLNASSYQGNRVGDFCLYTVDVVNGFELRDVMHGGFETHNHCSSQMGIPSNIVRDADNSWTGIGALDPADIGPGVDAHYATAEAWEYFTQKHGRNGFNGRGSSVTAYFNWGGTGAISAPKYLMAKFGHSKYGPQPLTTLDVVGHEWTHLVTKTSAGLRYVNQSGALNEATSDIFGTLIEYHANNPADPGDFLIGEKLPNPQGFIRNLFNPPADGHSIDHFSQYSDGMEVHYSSGIANKFFCLLVRGGKHHGVTVQSIGQEKAAKIWYRTLTVKLTENAEFFTARSKCIQSAGELGYNASVIQSVEDAWKAVGIDGTAY